MEGIAEESIYSYTFPKKWAAELARQLITELVIYKFWRIKALREHYSNSDGLDFVIEKQHQWNMH